MERAKSIHTQQATYQPELTIPVGEDFLTRMPNALRVFELVCILGHKYYLDEYPDFFFIVRKDVYDNDSELERVCVYRDNVINLHLWPDGLPRTLWISNELRLGRKITAIHADVLEKVENYILSINHKKKNK